MYGEGKKIPTLHQNKKNPIVLHWLPYVKGSLERLWRKQISTHEAWRLEEATSKSLNLTKKFKISSHHGYIEVFFIIIIIAIIITKAGWGGTIYLKWLFRQLSAITYNRL